MSERHRGLQVSLSQKSPYALWTYWQVLASQYLSREMKKFLQTTANAINSKTKSIQTRMYAMLYEITCATHFCLLISKFSIPCILVHLIPLQYSN